MTKEIIDLLVFDGVIVLALSVYCLGLRLRQPMVKRILNLVTFTAVIILALIFYWNREIYYMNKVVALRSDFVTAIYLRDLETVFESFHQVYHRWPAEPGPINDDCWSELLGDSTAKINTQHIDFFSENHILLTEQDRLGRTFYFNLRIINSQEKCIFTINEK